MLSPGDVRSGPAIPTAAHTIRDTTSRFIGLMREKPLGAFAGFVVVVLILTAVFASLIAPYDPLEQSRTRLLAPTSTHLLGTDELGRDVLSRLVFGARISLWIGIVAVGISSFFGTVLGLVSGYWGGKTIDHVIQRCVDSLMAFPLMFMALAVLAILGPGTFGAVVAIGIVMTPGTSRIVRGSVLSIRENTYIEAARSTGCRDMRIIGCHILPNVAAPVIILSALGLGNAILWEASISFLGVGTQPPNPSWGLMLAGSGREWFEVAWWNAFTPGFAITLAVLGFNLLGDTMRDILDPRLKQSRR